MLVPLSIQFRRSISPEREQEVLKACSAGWMKASKSKPGGNDDEKAKRAFRASKLPVDMREHFVASYNRARVLAAKRIAA